MTPEEQAELLKWKERAEKAELENGNFKKSLAETKAENEKLTRVNQEYFSMLAVEKKETVEPSKRYKEYEEEEEEAYTSDDIVNTLIKGAKKKWKKEA